MQTVGIIKGRITGPTSVELDEPVTSTGAEVEVWLKFATAPNAVAAPIASERLFDEAMLNKGLVSQLPPPPTPADIARFSAFMPAQVGGKPVSESIIEDRR